MRHGPPYTTLLKDFDKAVRKIGYEGDMNALVGNLNKNALEELMLSSYRMMKFLRKYLADIKCEYHFGYKIPDLYTALEDAIKVTTKKHMPLVSDEAAAMERVSRACYSWMRSYHLLKPLRALSPLERADAEFNRITAKPKPLPQIAATYKFTIEYTHHGHFLTDTVWETTADAARSRFNAQNGNLEIEILRVY